MDHSFTRQQGQYARAQEFLPGRCGSRVGLRYSSCGWVAGMRVRPYTLVIGKYCNRLYAIFCPAVTDERSRLHTSVVIVKCSIYFYLHIVLNLL
jgi:hypothetical protein